MNVLDAIRAAGERRRMRWIYERCRPYTMIGEQTFYNNLHIAEEIRHVRGCVVECGVWRGGMSAGLSYHLGPERTYYLFDSFAGLPPAKPIDGIAALEWQADTTSPYYYENCRASSSEAQAAMEQTASRNYNIVAGWFSDTLPNYAFPEPIALLRLDADWYDSTKECLENLFDLVAAKGIIIIDDYYAWDGCSRAVHDFLSHRSASERIRSFGGVCYIVKMPQQAQTSDGQLSA